MKKLLTILTLTAFAAMPATTFAAPKKEAAAPAEKPAEAKTPEAKPAEAEAKKPAEAKPLPMNTKVDAVDAAAKTFSHNNKDGTVVKFVVTDKTEIKNGEADAKLEDIKVGDTVSGLRIKKSPTEYEVVKITKFGAAPVKGKKAEGEKKAEPEKKDEAPKKVEGPGKPAEKAEKKN